jgi:hypothetical protein
LTGASEEVRRWKAVCETPLKSISEIEGQNRLEDIQPMKKIFQSLAFGALVTAFALPALALNHGAASMTVMDIAAQEAQAQDQAKADLYKKFTDNRKTNPTVAYDAAKEYMQKYGSDNDQYVQYLQKWIASYEKGARALNLNKLIYTDKNYAEAFSTGKQVVSEDPDNLKALIDLGFAGYSAAAATKADTYNADAIGYARRAIQLIESGKAPDDWKPFKGKDDTLAYLYYAIGVMNFKNNPAESIPAFIKATQFESDLKKNAASTYYLLATSYEAGPYKTMSTDFTARFQGKPETDESKLALANLNQVIDRIIDAYARAVAAAGTDPKNAQNKTDWMKRLTELYKFRHDNSDAGLNAYVAAISTTPLPPPPTPITTLPTTPSTTGTGDGASTGGTTTPPSGTAPAQPSKPATTTPAQPGNRTAPASTTAKPTPPTATVKPATTAKPSATAKPKTAHGRRP